MNIQEESGKLTGLLIAARDEENGTIVQRVGLWVQDKTGQKLSAYIKDPIVAEETRLGVIAELVEIIEKKDWTKLPKAPGGQQVKVVVPPEKKPEPKPEPEVQRAEDAPEHDCHPASILKPTKSGAPSALAEIHLDDEIPDPYQQIAELLRRAQPKATPTLTQADIERIVDARLAAVLIKIANVLKE